jgi:hypothetical protein
MGTCEVGWLTCQNCTYVFLAPGEVTPQAEVGLMSYARRREEYRYDLVIHDAGPPAPAGHFYARVLNMVRLESGHAVVIAVNFQDTYAATRHEAVSRMEEAIDAWIKRL